MLPVTTEVVNDGLVPKTKTPDPVSSVIADARLALLGVAKNVATPVPKPDTPVEIGNPVQFVNVPDVGVPSNGVTNVGDVAKTFEPVPVLSVSADDKFALLGVARKVATPVPSPDIPVDTGNPVQFVKVPEVGVPNKGVTSVGDVSKTSFPVPVAPVEVTLSNVTWPLADNVVNAPEEAVVSPIDVLFIEPPERVIFGTITLPVPFGVMVKSILVLVPDATHDVPEIIAKSETPISVYIALVDTICKFAFPVTVRSPVIVPPDKLNFSESNSFNAD